MTFSTIVYSVYTSSICVCRLVKSSLVSLRNCIVRLFLARGGVGWPLSVPEDMSKNRWYLTLSEREREVACLFLQVIQFNLNSNFS